MSTLTVQVTEYKMEFRYVIQNTMVEHRLGKPFRLLWLPVDGEDMKSKQGGGEYKTYHILRLPYNYCI